MDKLKNLEELHLDGNDITEVKGLENLESLTHLLITENKISEIKDYTVFPSKLEYIEIDRNPLLDIIIGELHEKYNGVF
ncbi:MAG: leucine-rich repeat domain-containing protein [Promethearchaeota archaeon]